MASIVSEKIAWGQVLFAESRNPGPPIRFWPIFDAAMCKHPQWVNESSEYETLSKAYPKLSPNWKKSQEGIAPVATKDFQNWCTWGNPKQRNMAKLWNGTTLQKSVTALHRLGTGLPWRWWPQHEKLASKAKMYVYMYVYMHIYISGEFAFELVFAKAIKHFTYLFQNKHWCWCGDKSSPMTADKSNNIICSVFETC